MSTGNSHPRNSADERRLYNDLDQRNKVRCCVCGTPWDEHPADTICNRHRPITFGEPAEIPPSPDPRRDPDQPGPQPGHSLDRELAGYRKMLPWLWKHFPNQRVVIKGDSYPQILPTFDDALKAGYEYFGLSGFLVKQILEHEPVLRGSVAWLAERDHLAGEVARLRAEVESLRADNAKLADSLASANERMILLQDIREAQAASIAKYRGELDAARTEAEALTVERDGLLAQLADADSAREDVKRTRAELEKLMFIHDRQVDELDRFEYVIRLIRAALARCRGRS